MSPQARRTEQIASDIAWTLCAAREIRLRLILARKSAGAKQRTNTKPEKNDRLPDAQARR